MVLWLCPAQQAVPAQVQQAVGLMEHRCLGTVVG